MARLPPGPVRCPRFAHGRAFTSAGPHRARRAPVRARGPARAEPRGRGPPGGTERPVCDRSGGFSVSKAVFGTASPAAKGLFGTLPRRKPRSEIVRGGKLRTGLPVCGRKPPKPVANGGSGTARRAGRPQGGARRRGARCSRGEPRRRKFQRPGFGVPSRGIHFAEACCWCRQNPTTAAAVFVRVSASLLRPRPIFRPNLLT